MSEALEKAFEFRGPEGVEFEITLAGGKTIHVWCTHISEDRGRLAFWGGRSGIGGYAPRQWCSFRRVGGLAFGEVSKDAARWRALMAAATSARGSAGLIWGQVPNFPGLTDGTVTVDPKKKGYMHAGIDFHTQASPGYFTGPQPKLAAAILTAIADQIIAQGGEAWPMVDGVRVTDDTKSR